MKIRAKYSQFQEQSNNGMLPEDGAEISDENTVKSILNRSRSIKITRLRSKRYTRRVPKSRFGGVVEEVSDGEGMSNAQPHYMKGTGSHQARKNSGIGLTRTPSWRPLRILSKIPSLRSRKSKVRKQPRVTPLSRTGINRATCSSTLKRCEFPDHIELHSGGRESEGTSIVHVCPYSYCSLNGHHHHAPSPPLKDFISAKRQSLKNQKGKTSTPKTDQSRQMVSAEIHAAQTVNPTPQEADDGLDFLITAYAKPRKKWGIEGNPSSDSDALTGITYSKTCETGYDWELPETPAKISSPMGRQESFNGGLQEQQGIFRMCSVEADNKVQQEISTTTSNEATEPCVSEEKIQSSSGDLINILSDEQKYTNIWHLIYQQFVSSDVPKTGTEGVSGSDEKEGVDLNTCHKGNELDQREAAENPAFDQTAALKLVQDGLIAILESKSAQDMSNSLARECTLTPEASTEENMDVEERPKKMKLLNPSGAEMPRQEMSKSYIRLRKIFVTAKIIKAMERMKRISPRQPRYLPVEPASEGERVYLRHLSRNEGKNTEEWMLDYALRWAISRLGPDQQTKVAKLVEAFETVTPEQREGITHYANKGKAISTRAIATPVNEAPEQTMSIPDEELSPQQDDEGLLSHKSGLEEKRVREAHEDQIIASGNICKPDDIQVNDDGMVEEAMHIPEESSGSPPGDSEVSHAGEMTMMFSNKQKYTCMWNLIYQHVTSSETSMDRGQGANVFDDEEHGGEAIKCIEINGPESISGIYDTNPKKDEDDQNAAGETNESDQSAAVKLVKEALDAILKRYEQSTEYESLMEDGKHVEKHANPESEEMLHLTENTTVSHQQQVEPNELKNPPREMSKSYKRLKKAFVTAKFINAIQRLRINSPRKTRSLPPDAGFKEERVYLRHLSINGRSDEECMLDYALRKVISKMAPDQQRRVAQLVEAFETVTPLQKKKGVISYPSEIEQMHQRSISDEQGYQVPQNQDHGILLSSEGASHDISMQEGHEHKASAVGRSISPSDVATEVSSIEFEETTRDADVSSCFPTEGSEVKSEGDIATILSDKQKYTSMWHLIHQQIVSSETSKVTKQEFNEVDEEECQELNYQDSAQISCMEKVRDKDSQSAVLDQSASIKLVKEAIDAILQSHEHRLVQQPLQYDDMTSDDAKGHHDTSASAPTEEKSQSKKRAEEDNTSVPPQEQDEEKAAQRKMRNSHSKLKKLFVTAKFIAAMERLRKINWRKPRHLPPEAASEDEKVYLRHLSIDGRKNHEEWMLDYALRNVISSLAPDQQRKVALIAEAFETVVPGRKGSGFEYHMKGECSPAIESDPIKDEKEIVDYEDSSMVCDDKCPKTQDDRFSLHICDPLERNRHEDCQTDISSIKTELSSKAPDSDQINLNIHHQASPKGCPVQDPLAVRKEVDANISRTLQHASLSETRQQDYEHNIGKTLFSDKQKNNSMWYLICQHLQSASASEGGNNLSERSGNNDHVERDDTSFEMMRMDAAYDDNDSDASSVASELTENDAIKLVKETIDDILEGPQVVDNELVSSRSISDLEKDQLAGHNPDKSLSRGYSKLRHLIICNKFIKTMQKMRKIHPQKKKIQARLKSGGAGEKKGTDEWMLDNVLQKVISGLAPAKQRRVALLVEAFEKVNPDQEERRTELIYMKTEPADAVSLEGNAKENGDTIFESSQLSSESPVVTTSTMTLATDRISQDICEDTNPSLRKERALNEEKTKGDTPFELTALPSVAISSSSDLCKDPTEVSCGDEQGVPANEMRTIEKQLVGHSDQATKVAKNTSLGKENNASLWGLILQHVKTDIPEKVEMQLSSEIGTDGINSENSSPFSPEGIHDKEADTPTPTSFELYESEAINLVQEAVNELLVLPEQAGDSQFLSTNKPSEDKKARPKDSLPSTYSKLSKVIMCKRFINTMNKMRQLKPQPPQEPSHTTHTVAKGNTSLRQTATGDKKSWEEGMLDHALQQVVGKLAPAQKKRVALLVQAFETVGS